MRKFSFTVLCSVVFICSISAQPRKNIIREMKWGLESTISLTMANDSVYAINIDDIFQTDQNPNSIEEAIYFPVGQSYDCIEKYKNNNISKDDDKNLDNIYNAVHSVTGGNFAHFLNLVMYSLQTYQLDLKAPEMMRPITKWRPSPVTESYIRTKRWKYYVPVDYKNAKKEYEFRKKKNKMAELEGIPMAFIRRSNKTKDAKYYKLSNLGYNDLTAEIDLVRLMLGSNFLGKEQIRYIRNSVLQAVSEYKIYDLPSLIIFNNYKAAVAMSLDATGYKIEGIVFSENEKIEQVEKDRRTAEIQKIIQNINDANQRSIEKKIKKLYE
jgi:hypothetical protein